MGLLNTLRTCYNLATKVEELSQRVESLSFQWTDFLDMQRAREERQRKRDRTALSKLVAADTPDQATLPLPDDRKSRLRALVAQKRRV